MKVNVSIIIIQVIVVIMVNIIVISIIINIYPMVYMASFDNQIDVDMVFFKVTWRNADALQVNFTGLIRLFAVIAKHAHQSLRRDGQYRR